MYGQECTYLSTTCFYRTKRNRLTSAPYKLAYLPARRNASDDLHFQLRARHIVHYEGRVPNGSCCWMPLPLEAGNQEKAGGLPHSKELIGTNGVMNILTAIPNEKIIPKGIPYCRRGCDESSHQSQFDAFWDYFVKTGMIRCNPRIWNVHSFTYENSEFTLIHRTNHPLERFNRKMNDSFPTPHPTMTSFVERVRQNSDDYVNDLTRIAKGTMCKPIHLLATVYSILESYRTFTT